MSSGIIQNLALATRILQFRTEEPDEVRRARRIDLVPAARGEAIWIEGRKYSDFDALLPIECKRLPTPAGERREKREYLLTRSSTTGGVQRFKAGHHGAGHSSAVMIGYIQRGGVGDWLARLDRWICAFVRAGVQDWDLADRLSMIRYDASLGIGVLRSEHRRPSGYDLIAPAAPVDRTRLIFEFRP